MVHSRRSGDISLRAANEHIRLNERANWSVCRLCRALKVKEVVRVPTAVLRHEAISGETPPSRPALHHGTSALRRLQTRSLSTADLHLVSAVCV
ncbi:hypothetical protein SKAU_G00404330 [Synaphobranchus kaupii]|uniref:Uncharacterized protein n=1 Tax=Synaphobranchus kaupii TaxID=118154 RepID=A0A9Q1E9P1_SYNKA|nr:hypothetical protein SKAU_G00404330 [Synaphobranchus kaupii]